MCSEIAVLLAAYNGKRWLEEQVLSILHQGSVRITLFISVDRSSDATEKLVDELVKNDHRITVLPHGSLFGGAATNFFRLIREVNFTKFDYVSFADQDDIWYLDKLKRSIEQIELHCVDAYSSNVIAFWPSGKKLLVCKSQPQRKWDFLFESAGPGCTFILKKELMLDIQQCIFKNSDYMQDVGLHDWFCYAYARANGYKWYIDPKPSLLYRQHEVNQYGANAGIKAFIWRVNKIINGWGIEQAALLAQLVGIANNDFVKSWSAFNRQGFFSLAFSAYECRRKMLDRCLFFIACFSLAIIGKRKP